MSLTDKPIGSAVTDATSGQPVITVATATSLVVALVNNSGADIPLTADTAPATFGIYMPSGFFTSPQLDAMGVSTTGWSAKVNAAEMLIEVLCTRAGVWAADATLTLTITNVLSDGPPATGNVTIAPSNMGRNLPLSLQAPLAVAGAHKPGNASLAKVLQVTLDSQGAVYRSTSADPLTNTLFLTLKNVGATALATETTTRPGNPQVLVSFVYGATSGALASDAYDPRESPLGSAWNIKLAIQSAQLPWTATNPRWSSEMPSPQWTLAPASSNFGILGPAGSDQANVTFAFSRIVSLTPVGHTQMLVLCTGFAKDAHTNYDDHVFVLDIVKLDAPPTRGLLSFSASEPLVMVSDPDAPVAIKLKWAMFDVAGVRLLTSAPSLAPRSKHYTEPQPLAYDDDTISLPPLHSSQAIFTTLQAFDGTGAYLNSLQFTVYAQLAYVTDAAGRVYTIALIGDTFWMTQNYAFATSAGSYVYNDNPANEGRYGRLYDRQAAQENAPEGWELPSAQDWQALVGRYGDSSAAYAALIAGGSSGFDALLGGQRTILPGGQASYEQIGRYGYYWTAAGTAFAEFSGVSEHASANIPLADPTRALSVRYVRHV